MWVVCSRCGGTWLADKKTFASNIVLVSISRDSNRWWKLAWKSGGQRLITKFSKNAQLALLATWGRLSEERTSQQKCSFQIIIVFAGTCLGSLLPLSFLLKLYWLVTKLTLTLTDGITSGFLGLINASNNILEKNQSIHLFQMRSFQHGLLAIFQRQAMLDSVG